MNDTINNNLNKPFNISFKSIIFIAAYGCVAAYLATIGVTREGRSHQFVVDAPPQTLYKKKVNVVHECRALRHFC